MPDVREVYQMVTQQKAPEPGALERQQKRQVRAARSKQIGGFAVAAVIGIAAIVLIVTTRSHETTKPAQDGSTENREATAVGVTDRFLTAFDAFDAEKAMSYVADGGDLGQFIDGQVPDDAEGMSLMVGWLEAMGYRELNTSCRATESTPTLGTTVVCTFDFHGIRSDEIGKGPFTDNTHTFVVRDSKIVYGTISWNLDVFSPQMWEPFQDWVRENHPKDLDRMYIDGGANFRLTPRSIRLWEQRTQEWADEVAR